MSSAITIFILRKKAISMGTVILRCYSSKWMRFAMRQVQEKRGTPLRISVNLVDNSTTENAVFILENIAVANAGVD